MDTVALVSFLAGGSLVASLIVNVLKGLFKKVSDRYGSLVTQVLLLVVSALVAVGMWYIKFLPPNFVANSAFIFAGAITLYEVFYKALFQEAIKGKVA